jgi:hypothetical protein
MRRREYNRPLIRRSARNSGVVNSGVLRNRLVVDANAVLDDSPWKSRSWRDWDRRDSRSVGGATRLLRWLEEREGHN